MSGSLLAGIIRDRVLLTCFLLAGYFDAAQGAYAAGGTVYVARVSVVCEGFIEGLLLAFALPISFLLLVVDRLPH